MGSGRTLNKKPRTRPVKSAGQKRRRSAMQRKRLIKLGMSESDVAKMQNEDVRRAVLFPAKVKARVAAAAQPAG